MSLDTTRSVLSRTQWVKVLLKNFNHGHLNYKHYPLVKFWLGPPRVSLNVNQTVQFQMSIWINRCRVNACKTYCQLYLTLYPRITIKQPQVICCRLDIHYLVTYSAGRPGRPLRFTLTLYRSGKIEDLMHVNEDGLRCCDLYFLFTLLQGTGKVVSILFPFSERAGRVAKWFPLPQLKSLWLNYK